MADAGIVSYGVYVPWYRISRKTVADAMGWLNVAGAIPGEKAVADYDEDSVSMAVAACGDCLIGIDRSSIDGLFFATTSAPYRERESAAIIATALDLNADMRSADFGDSLKGWVNAVVSGCEAVASGNLKNVLVCASDFRLGRAGGLQEMLSGNASGAVLMGSNNVIARFDGGYSLCYDFPDYRRSERDTFVRATEERFIREEGYTKFIAEAILGLMKKYGLKAQDVSRVAFPCFNIREHQAIAKRLSFQPQQVQEPFLNSVGEMGTASVVVMLAGMLDEAKPGDRIVVAGYGNGAMALCFTVTEAIASFGNRGRLKKYLDSKKELTNYQKSVAFRGILPVDMPFVGETAFTELPMAWRERRAIMALTGSRCKRCGTPQYPPQRICVNPECKVIDEMESYGFAGRKGKVFSFTEDYTASCLNPPLIYAMIEFEGGGRFVFEMTDCEAGMVKTSMPVQMTFRRKYVDELRGLHGYFWKAAPVRA